MELDGTVIGKFGKAGKQLKEFSTMHEHGLPQRKRTVGLRDHRVARAEDRPASSRQATPSPPPRRRRDKGG